MSKQLAQTAKNDLLIFELIENPNYRISENGVIETLVQQNGKVGKEWRIAGCLRHGYVGIRFRGAVLCGHRIVWAKFKGYLRCNLVINHIDGNRSNNALSNLELVTQSTNNKHAYRSLGKNPNRGNAKLSWATVDAIRSDYNSGEYTMRKLKEKYTPIALGTVHGILAGTLYKEELKDGSN